MSASATHWAWGHILGGRVDKDSAKIILLRLCDQSSTQGEYPFDTSTVSSDAGVCKKTAAASLRELQQAGLVQIKEQFDRRGKQLASKIRLKLPGMEDFSTELAQEEKSSLPEAGKNFTPLRVEENSHPVVPVVVYLNNNNNVEQLRLDRNLLGSAFMMVERFLRDVPLDRRQMLADEICGQFRTRGAAIKNLASFAFRVVKNDRESDWKIDHRYAYDEYELRRKREEVDNILKLRGVSQPSNSKPPVPMPAISRAYQARLKREVKHG